MSCGVGHRRGSYPALLWLWHRLVATAPIGSLVWEPPYVAGVALKSKKKKKKKKREKGKKKTRAKDKFFSLVVAHGTLSLFHHPHEGH